MLATADRASINVTPARLAIAFEKKDAVAGMPASKLVERLPRAAKSVYLNPPSAYSAIRILQAPLSVLRFGLERRFISLVASAAMGIACIRAYAVSGRRKLLRTESMKYPDYNRSFPASPSCLQALGGIEV